MLFPVSHCFCLLLDAVRFVPTFSLRTALLAGWPYAVRGVGQYDAPKSASR